MSLNIVNLDKVQKTDPKLGEALQKIQTYVNANTTQAAGNRIPPPGFVNPHQPQG